jgi:molybdopterin molybdotransferase
MIPIEEALERVLENTRPLPMESIAFTEAAGRLLREDVSSDIDMPPFPRSAVDGFALRSRDVESVPAMLRVVGTVPAGSFPDFRVADGEAASIMTGAPVPEGADAVQMVEQTTRADDEVEVRESVRPGQNIAPRGSEVIASDTVLRAGTRLDPAAVAVLATVGKTRVSVGRRPDISVIATGDELVHPSETPGPGQIRNSNGFSLMAQCAAVGAVPRYLGVARDSEHSLVELIQRGLEADVLLLSGGVSMGRFDLVEDVLGRLGVRILVESVRLKPGKPLVFGISEHGKLVFGLPGNPVSTMVTFELFVRTAIARLEGADLPIRPLLAARLAARLASRGPRRAYLPGWVRVTETGEPLATPIPTRGSGDIVAFSKSNALLVVPEERDEMAQGERVRFYPLDSFFCKEDRWQIAPSQS